VRLDKALKCLVRAGSHIFAERVLHGLLYHTFEYNRPAAKVTSDLDELDESPQVFFIDKFTITSKTEAVQSGRFAAHITWMIRARLWGIIFWATCRRRRMEVTVDWLDDNQTTDHDWRHDKRRPSRWGSDLRNVAATGSV
jgi:hypothetical protein